MGRKIRERIIRRLGGVPIWLFGRFPYPTDNWEQRILERFKSQSEEGLS